MKIVLDLMPLGAGMASSSGKTGIYRVTDNLARGLLSGNCELTYVASRYHREARTFLLRNADYKGVLSYPSDRDIFLEKVRNKVKAIPFVNHLLPLTNLQRLARTNDIYHSTYRPVPEDITIQKHIVPFLTVHDIIPILYPQYFGNNNDPLVKLSIESIRKRGWVFCVSEATKNDLCNYCGFPAERVFVAYPAASRLLFYPVANKEEIDKVKAKYGIGRSRYFLSLCTFEPRKNIGLIIKSFVKLLQQEKVADIQLVLIGTKGWDYEQIFKEIEGTQLLRSKIILTGYVEDSDVAYLYSGALCFLYPSFYEGFGLPPLEAMQCGVPVITSNTSSLPEVVGDAGLTVDPYASEELADAMLKILNSSSLEKELAEKSLAQSEKFTWESFTLKTIDGYRRAIDAG